MRVALIAGLALLAACQREATSTQPSAPLPKPNGEIAITAAPATADVEGWHTDVTGYARMSTTAPAFKLKTLEGKDVSQDTLREHWTILAFWGVWSDDSKADAKYIRALSSAVDQDPNLDLLTVHIPQIGGTGTTSADAKTVQDWFAKNGGAWPTAVDVDGKAAAAFRVDEAPFYLLVGPDLTIEGYRGDLSETPDDGIKSVIRGVAEIKKQIADPT